MATARQKAAARRNLVKARAAKAAKRTSSLHASLRAKARKRRPRKATGWPTGKRTLLVHNSLQPNRIVATQRFKAPYRRTKPYTFFTTRQHAHRYGSSKTAVTVSVPRKVIRRDYPEYLKTGAVKVKQSDLKGLPIRKWSGKGWRSAKR